MRLVLTSHFTRKIKSFLKKHPELIDEYKKVAVFLMKDHKNPALKIHKLKGDLKNF